MSTSIVDLPMPFEPQEKRLSQSNSQWAAKLDLGASWSNIRIGWRWAADDFNALNLWDTQCYMGLMTTPDSGITNGPLSWQTEHFVGIRRFNYNVYTVAATPYWSTSWNMSKKIGTTITNSAPAISTALFSTDPSSVRTIHIIDFQVVGPLITVSHVTCEGVSGFLDIEERSVLEDAMNEATVALATASINTYIGGGGTRYSNSSASLAVNQVADGALNTFVAGWPLVQNLYLSEVLFRKLS